MHRGQSQGLKERRAMRETYGEMFDACSQAMHDGDLLGIAGFDPPLDEYDYEATKVVPRLAGCLSRRQVELVLHEELARLFDPETRIPPQVIDGIAARLWRLMEVHGWR